MTINPFKDIKDFHEKFGLDYAGPPRRLPPELAPFRTKFMGEELAEYITDDKNGHAGFALFVKSAVEMTIDEGNVPPLEKQFDALIDLVYVALGNAYLHGFNFDEGWRRVHAANMAKVRAERADQSLRGSTFDVVKPPGWTPPDLSDLVTG